MTSRASGSATATTTGVTRGSSSVTRVTETPTAGDPAIGAPSTLVGGLAPSGGWRQAVVKEVHHPNTSAVLLRLEVANRIDHLPGQHYVVRLRADDGYVAQRSYSVASPAADPLVELYVARLEEGEVSTFLADVVEVGDELEVRGPIGGWFVWDGQTPALGIGGGSGVVPLVSMLRHAAASGGSDRLRVVAAARSPLTLPYAEELADAGAHIAYSRVASDLGRPPGRLNADDLRPLIRAGDTAFVCGSAAFAEATGALLLDLGVPAAAIRVERFGPSGL